MTPADVTAFSDFLQFLQAIGVGFGDLVILIVLFGAGWFISKGKIKIGNGNGHYVEQQEYRDDMIEIKGDIKAIRAKCQDLDRDMVETKTKLGSFLEQYKRD